MKQTTSIKLDPIVKKEVQEIFTELGLTLGEAVNLFLNQVRLRKGIPFDIEIPNKTTRKILTEVRNGQNTDIFTMDDLKRA